MNTLSRKWLSLMLIVSTILALFTGCAAKTSEANNSKSNEQAVENKQEAVEATKIEKLRIGLIPAESNEEIITQFKPTLDYLAKELDVEIEPFVAMDYTAVVEAMRSGHVDAAFLGPFAYILAADKANAEAFAVGVREDGNSSYNTLFLTHKDTGIKTLNDLKGKNISFVDPASASGNLFPRAYLMKNNIDPNKDFKSATYAGGHDAAILAAKNKKVDAAVSNDITFEKMVKEGLVTKEEMVIISKTDPIPGPPIAVRKDLDADFKEKLKQAFLKMHEKSPQALGGYGKIIRYDEATDTDYNVVRETAKLLNLDPAQVK
ncbi:phosphonate ABC transporter substrate-binding protein [Paenibacillus solisilvae]|uniref:Phosphonate ABC transporter substrate-binding protein n=1 Tax=Paenibacillus solisilvae TaxID=2486751 RepID=A0ABW0W895_9BACL